MTHLAEKEHKGVLTGSPITDIHFTFVAGKASPLILRKVEILERLHIEL